MLAGFYKVIVFTELLEPITLIPLLLLGRTKYWDLAAGFALSSNV